MRDDQFFDVTLRRVLEKVILLRGPESYAVRCIQPHKERDICREKPLSCIMYRAFFDMGNENESTENEHKQARKWFQEVEAWGEPTMTPQEFDREMGLIITKLILRFGDAHESVAEAKRHLKDCRSNPKGCSFVGESHARKMSTVEAWMDAIGFERVENQVVDISNNREE